MRMAFGSEQTIREQSERAIENLLNEDLDAENYTSNPGEEKSLYHNTNDGIQGGVFNRQSF